MPQYTVRDRETGQEVTFNWTAPDPPNEADLADVFAEARRRGADTGSAAPTPDALDRLLGLLPTVGGIAGGILGGIGGTVGGVGIGGVPGAVGGAAIGGAGGEGMRQAIQTARGKEAPRTAGEALTDIGQEGLVQGASEAIGGAVTKGAGKAAHAVYRGYLKPSLSARLAPKANQIVETALNEAIPISRGGVEASQQVINDLRGEVEAILTRSGGVVDLKAIGDRVRAYAKQRYFRPGADVSDYQQALAVADKIDSHPSLGSWQTPPTQVPVAPAEANLIKRALDTSVKEAGYGVPTGAKKSAEKYGRHALRTALEGAEPRIAPLNAREAKLIDAAKAVARAVAREANQYQLHGTKNMAALLGGSMIGATSDLTTGAATVAAGRALLDPTVMSWASIVAHRLQKELGIGAASAARLAHYALADQEGQEP